MYMNIDQFTRDADKVHAALKEVGNQLIAVKECKIYVPEHYMGSFLGSMDDDGVRIIGIYGITVDDKYYATSRCTTMINIDPSIINIVEIDGMNYMEFFFQKGDVVIKNTNLICISTLLFRIYDEIVAKGKVPWYITYQDLCLLFDTAKAHGEVNLGVESAIIEMVGSSMARNSEDKTLFFRHLLKTKADKEKLSPEFVGLRSVAYGATNTTAKLLGAYFQEGMTSALITKSERSESIEEILRK